MNNVRKIIAEKIADKKDKRVNDYADGFNDGLIEAFKIFLEEIPAPRTEQDILKDFEKLGWKVVDGYTNFTLKKNYTTYGSYHTYNWNCYISIDKENKTYSAYKISAFATKGYDLTMQEHKLLNELFALWGWL